MGPILIQETTQGGWKLKYAYLGLSRAKNMPMGEIFYESFDSQQLSVFRIDPTGAVEVTEERIGRERKVPAIVLRAALAEIEKLM